MLSINKESDLPEYNRKVYIPSPWMPPIASSSVEQCLSNFEKNLTNISATKNNAWPHRGNININLLHLLHELRHHPDFIVVESNKNLGPVIIERAEYIEMVLKNHLLTETYRRLGPGELYFKEQVVRKHIRTNIELGKRNKSLSEEEITYFERALKCCSRVPQFFILVKIHKSPLESRPVTGSGGSLLWALSKWVDQKLQPLVRFLPTYVCYWKQIK